MNFTTMLTEGHQAGMSHWVYGFDGRNVPHSVWASLNHWDLRTSVCHHWAKITDCPGQSSFLLMKINKSSNCPPVSFRAETGVVRCCPGADWWATEKWPHRLVVAWAPSLGPSWWWHHHHTHTAGTHMVQWSTSYHWIFYNQIIPPQSKHPLVYHHIWYMLT